MNIDLRAVELAEGWTRKGVMDGLRVVEARDPARELTIPLNVVGPHKLSIEFFTYGNRRDASMQMRVSSQPIWRRLRPMRFIDDDCDAVQPVDAMLLDIQPGDALHIRTEPASYIAIAGMGLTSTTPAAPAAGERRVAFVHDTNMSFSKYTIEKPEDLFSILQPYVGSHITHVFFGTGVGTYSPLYDSKTFGWHGREQKEFMADHRARTADVMRMLMAAGKDPLAMAVEYAHERPAALGEPPHQQEPRP